MVTTSYYGDNDEVQAVFVGNQVVNVRTATGYSAWNGVATSWTTIKRFF